MNVTRSRNSGCCSRNRSKAREAAQDVLRQVRAVDAQDQALAPPPEQLGLELLRARGAGDLLGRLVVDRQRVGAHPDLATVGRVHDAVVEVDVEVHEVAAALQEVPAVRARVEADDVVGEQALVDLAPDARRQHAPGVGLRPRDVDEVVQEDVRARAPDEPRQRVEVVVVDHDDGVVDALDLLDDRLGQVVVDDVVAVLERLDLVAADVRRVGQVPEVVLDEPQHRVREDVVEAVVGLVVADDEAHVELAALRGVDDERLAARLARAGACRRR